MVRLYYTAGKEGNNMSLEISQNSTIGGGLASIFYFFILAKDLESFGRSRASISSQANHRSIHDPIMNMQFDRLSNIMCAVCIPPNRHAIPPWTGTRQLHRSMACAGTHAVVLATRSLWELRGLLVFACDAVLGGGGHT